MLYNCILTKLYFEEKEVLFEKCKKYMTLIYF